MAKFNFVKVTKTPENEEIYLNVDLIISLKKRAQGVVTEVGTTIGLLPGNTPETLDVSEELDEITQQIKQIGG
jgi:hypothetical protein